MSSPNLFHRDIISTDDFTKKDIVSLIRLAEHYKKSAPPDDTLSNMIFALCFFEPSTRTRLSFETAILRLGGKIIGFSDSSSTSSSKGESLSDTIQVIGSYADALIIRHPMEGAAQCAADATDTPVINGGDGSNQHPTQTLIDLFSIYETQHTLDEIHIAICGDLKYGRTAHSLTQACALFNVQLSFVSPEQLQLPAPLVDSLKTQDIPFSFHRTLEEVIENVDVVYMTRIQEERFFDRNEYQRSKGSIMLTPLLLHTPVKENMVILHPLPRVDEIDHAIDNTRHAYYFQQAHNGIFVRQALLALIMGRSEAAMGAI